MKVAIDGPAGSGKSTVAKLVAKKLGFKHVDTGAYYRWLTYQVLQHKIDLNDQPSIIALAQKTDFQNIEDSKIRTVKVTNTVSLVSAIKEVRQCVVAQQRIAAESNDVVMEGRDIGSVVFPDAEVKIFLTASVEERAKRRYEEMIAKGVTVDLLEIQKDIEKRDAYDSGRKASPLKKTADAYEVDTTGLSIDQVVEKIITIVRQKQV